MKMRLAATLPAKHPPLPGESLLHPLVLSAVALMLVNDHVWKPAYGNFWTGKISDVAVLIFFPLLLQAFWETTLDLAGKKWAPSRRALLGCLWGTAVGFTAIQVVPMADGLYEWTWGVLQWPFRTALHLFLTGQTTPLLRVAHTADPTDLMTLPLLAVAYWIGRKRIGA